MGRIIKELVIPAKEYLGLEVRRGQVLRIIDLEGQQVIDFVAFNLKDYEEKLSCVYSNYMSGRWQITKGHHIYTNRCKKMWTIVEDKVGRHFTGGGF